MLGTAVAFAASPPQTANEEEHPIRVSHAEITLKSATLPRRKLSQTEGSTPTPPQTPKAEVPSRFHPEVRKTSLGNPYSPVYSQTASRSASLEPQQIIRPREHYIPIQRPSGDGYIVGPGAASASQQSVRSSQLSRQSTVDSDISDTTTTQSTMSATANSNSSSQPIKKSPREFIIPIAVEGGGYVTPRAGSLEPSDSNKSAGMAFRRLGNRRKKFGLFMDRDSEDESNSSPFNHSLHHRNTSVGRDGESEDGTSKFTYRLRSSRPSRKLQTDINDSASSGEEDDEDGFEILTAENLFSTLLSRVSIHEYYMYI